MVKSQKIYKFAFFFSLEWIWVDLLRPPKEIVSDDVLHILWRAGGRLNLGL